MGSVYPFAEVNPLTKHAWRNCRDLHVLSWQDDASMQRLVGVFKMMSTVCCACFAGGT